MSNVEHHIAGSNDCAALSEQEAVLAVGRQIVVEIDHVLGVVDSLEIFAWQAQPLGPLSPGRDQDRLKAHGPQVVEGQVALRANDHIAVIIKIG